MILTIVLTAAATAFLIVVGMNFKTPEKQMERKVEHKHPVRSDQFHREMGAIMGPLILGGNQVSALHNGDEIFPAMIEAVAEARSTITFETYIYWSGKVGTQFADALVERSRAGVKVKVLVDWAGSVKMDDDLISVMEGAGIELHRYHPLRWYSLGRLNNRTHRKLLVIDGRVGFTGGVGIADQWGGNAQDPEHWRDVHFRVVGPVVAQLQAAFMDNWIKANGEVLNGPDYFPPLESPGDADAHMFISSPSGGAESMHLMFLLSIAAAAQTVDIAASYFVPDKLIIQALIAAAERGVRVRVLVPGEHIDSKLVALSSKRVWGDLLKAGVQIREYTRTMLHTKVLIIDGHMVSVGSTNFDIRSFRLNDEASLNLYDQSFAAQMTTVFEADLEHSRLYTYELWESRPWREKFAETVLIPIKSQL